MDQHESLEDYKDIEEKSIDGFELNDIPQRNRHTFVVTKEFLKRETGVDGKQFYPISREQKQILKISM